MLSLGPTLLLHLALGSGSDLSAPSSMGRASLLLMFLKTGWGVSSCLSLRLAYERANAVMGKAGGKIRPKHDAKEDMQVTEDRNYKKA